MGKRIKFKRTFIFTLGICLLCAVVTFAKKQKRSIGLIKKALYVLVDVSRNGSVESKAIAAGIWPITGSQKAQEELLLLLKDTNHNVMSRAARALSAIGDRSGKEYCDEVTKESFHIAPDVSNIEKFKRYSRFKFRKISAVKVLGTIGGKESFRQIRILRNDTPDGQIRDACSIALAMLGEPGERLLFENAVGLSTKDPEIRKTAVRALGTIASRSSIEVLKKSLYDPESFVRAAAAEALAKIGDISAAGSLREHINDEEVTVQREVVRALGVIVDQENISFLKDALQHNDGIVKIIAAGSLGAHGLTRGLRFIKQAMKDKDRDVRLHAVRSLDQIFDKKVFSLLEILLEDKDDVVRIEASRSIIRKLVQKNKK